jgi:drug/metabolite transporter (DMT)-like permease
MLFLLITSLIWAFSFPLIGHTLQGIDPVFLGTARMGLSLLIFIPLLRLRHVSLLATVQLLLIGAVQFGVMYITYLKAYTWLQAHEVALFTIFTPLYATLINDLLTRRFHPLFLITSTLAVLGTAIIKYTPSQPAGLWQGILLVQASNLCFAFGQIYYRHVMQRNPRLTNTSIYALLYLGAFAVCGIWALSTNATENIQMQPNQIMVLLYLGIVASGIGFFLWNTGARRVDAGALAIFNNLKIPLAIAVSLLFFREQTNIPRLLIGGSIVLAALLINERRTRS